jgi:hypothetical protein
VDNIIVVVIRLSFVFVAIVGIISSLLFKNVLSTLYIL